MKHNVQHMDTGAIHSTHATQADGIAAADTLGDDWCVTEVLEPGDRVCAGEADDYDTGTIDSVDGDIAIVRWDSGVTTPCPFERLFSLD